MAINSVSLYKDVTLWTRDVISGAIPDPVSDRQRQSLDPGSGSRFVMTSYPSRAVVYPFITVSQVNATDESLGIGTEDSLTTLRMQVDVWTMQVGQRDGIAGSVAYALRTSQLGTDGAYASGLFDYALIGMRNMDDPAKTGVHRKVLDFEVIYINTT